jgi:hypothetical protein
MRDQVMTRQVDLDHAYLFCTELRDLARRLSASPTDEAIEQELNEAFLGTLGSMPLGSPFTFIEQYAGTLVHNVRPAIGHEAERSSRGRAELDIHTDDSFLDVRARAEHLAFGGVQNAEGVPTYVVHIDDVLELLDADTIAALSQPSFSFACPASFDLDTHHALMPPSSILRAAADGRIEVSFATRTGVADPGDVDSAHHLERFRSAIGAAPRSIFKLGAGAILIVSNSRCLHGRPPVLADRWLKRVYLRRDFGLLDRAAATGSSGVYTASAVLAGIGPD